MMLPLFRMEMLAINDNSHYYPDLSFNVRLSMLRQNAPNIKWVTKDMRLNVNKNHSGAKGYASFHCLNVGVSK